MAAGLGGEGGQRLGGKLCRLGAGRSRAGRLQSARRAICRTFGKFVWRRERANFDGVNGGVNGVESMCPSEWEQLLRGYMRP